MSTAHISVLLPMRDAASTIETALRSVQRQREPNWECVVVDDGSHDDGPERVLAIASRDPRVRLVRGPRAGLVPTLLLGQSYCHAPLVARMDADDWMHRDRLALQQASFDEQPDLGVVGCHVRLFPRSALAAGMRRYEAWLNSLRDEAALLRDAFVECPLAHPTLMIRRDLLERFPYRDAGWPEDYDLLLRLMAAGERIAVLPRRLHGWRHGSSRLSQRSSVYGSDRFTACKAAFLAEGLLGQATDYILWGYGSTGRALHRALSGHGRQAAWIIELHPRRLGNRIHGAPVVPPESLLGLPRLPLIVSVAGAGPREEIRRQLAEWGREEGRDFLCAA